MPFINKFSAQLFYLVLFFLSFIEFRCQNDTLLIKEKIDEAMGGENFEVSVKLLQETERQSLKQNNKRWQAEPLIALGVLYYHNNKFGKSISTYEKALDICTKYNLSQKKAKLYFYICASYSRVNEHQKSFEAALNALRIYESLHNELGMAIAYQDMGDELYGDFNKSEDNFRKAKQYYQLAIDIFRKQKDYSRWVSALNNYAVLYMDAAMPKEALEKLENAKSMFNQYKEHIIVSPSSDIWSDLLTNKGWIYLAGFKRSDEAIIYIKEAITYCQTKFDYEPLLARNYLNLTEAYIDTKQYRLAKEACDSAILKANIATDIYSQAASYQNLYFLDSLEGNYLKALYDKTKYQELKDSIASTEKLIQLEALNVQYETEKKDLENEKLMEKANFRRNIIIALIVILITFFLSLYFYFRSKRFETKLLKQKAINLENENEALLLDKMLEEEENRRLREENESQNRQLTANTISLEQNKNALQSVYENLNAINKEINQEDTGLIRQLKSNIKSNLNFSGDWNSTSQHFEKLHPNFLNHLKNLNPNLTQNDLRHCAYIKLNLNTKEIASILNIDSKSVRINRYRIKKKLNLSEEQDLFDYISAIQ
jgi:tetratricopeptide (TPR) repeat protein/DNA-binding CsgD family transcriptional regulator